MAARKALVVSWVDIPDSNRLDLDYKGVVAGIEVREVEANNGHSFGNIAFDGSKLTITLRAKGAGNRRPSLSPT